MLEAVAAAGGTAAIQARGCVGGEIAAMIGSGVLTPALAAQDIDAAVTANVLTADQAMCVLAGVIATGNASAQSAAAGEIVFLISNNTIMAAAAIADIDTAFKTSVLTGDRRKVSVLASVAAAGGPALPAAAAEIMSLINSGSVTAVNAMADIGNAVTAHALAGDRAVGLLAGLAGAGTAALQAAAANEIVALINATSGSPAAGAMADIDTAVKAQLLTGAQALTVLLDVATKRDCRRNRPSRRRRRDRDADRRRLHLVHDRDPGDRQRLQDQGNDRRSSRCPLWPASWRPKLRERSYDNLE